MFTGLAIALILLQYWLIRCYLSTRQKYKDHTMAFDSRRNYQPARIGTRDFWLVPQHELHDGFPFREQTKAHTSLLRYNDLVAKEYTYDRLPQDKKRIRLMKLYSGEPQGNKIYCELIEVEYDRQFHIPTNIQSNAGEKDDDESSKAKTKDTNTNPSLAEDDDKDRLETLNERRARIERQATREVLKLVEGMKETKEKLEAEAEAAKTKRTEEWKKVKNNEVLYEALSWCWGSDDEDYAVLIKKRGTTYKKRVRKELALALKYLRRAGRERMLWIDAICIDQANPSERNHQVQMMSRIYTRAQKVCVWLGEADADSEMAIKFIKDEMKELKHFDTITTDEQYSRKWQALMSLMQRDWFFRRWVVQEIALASAAKVYCGPHSVSWKSFAVAVELFVEVETATHRLSEVMKRDEKFRHVPGWFEYVSELGASLLVQATGRVFRTKRTPMQQSIDTSDEESEGEYKRRDSAGREEALKERQKIDYNEQLKRVQETHTIDPLERRSLLSLEYLVSTMFIFQTSEPRDVAYALLAIARDASPFGPAHVGQEDQKLFLIMTLLDQFLAEKPFTVDYTRPYSDVSRDFVSFSIARKHKTDPHQALDILCRPWALEPPKKKSARVSKEGSECKSPSNKKGLGLYSKAKLELARIYRSTLEKREEQWKTPCVEGCEHNDPDKCPGYAWRPPQGWETLKSMYFAPPKDTPSEQDDISLPSWVARASQAPFMLDHAPGMDMRKTSRANADPLVGPPQDGHRNYNAAGSDKLDLGSLRFRKRPRLGHYSLYVKGFKLDEVDHVEDASQLGSIPKAWMECGDWKNLNQDPPDEFWRTIVADRGRDNRNPPYYYARACQESVHKGGHLGGSVNTTALINDEQNSIIAEFCRRVHAVIWNRCLFKTKGGRLGLATKVKRGDKVCILPGCTVPVILKETKKSSAQDEKTGKTVVQLEAEEDRAEALKACTGRLTLNLERKVKYRGEKKKYSASQWEEMMDARQAYLEERRAEKKGAPQEQASASQKAKWKKYCQEQAEKIKMLDEKVEDTKAQQVGGIASDTDERGPVDLLKKFEEEKKTVLDEVRKKAVIMARLDDPQPSDGTANDAQSTDPPSTAPAIPTDGSASGASATSSENAAADPTPLDDHQSGTGSANDGRSAYDAPAAPTAQSEERSAGEGAAGTPSASSEIEYDKDPRNFWYEFKGECYIHGMMDGEAMREKFYKDFPDWLFELR